MSSGSRPIENRMLNANTDFDPCPCGRGDEIFRNGIFEFNVTKNA